jgi:excisionase family DNA binding protein
MDGPSEDDLTAREVAQALGVSERTVYQYVEEGLIAAVERPAGRMRRLSFTARAVEQCRELLRQVRAQARSGQ